MDENRTKYAGMTLNERLMEAGLFYRWKAALARYDRQAMVPMLVAVDLTADEAEKTANAALRRSYFARLRKALDAMSPAELSQEYARQFGRPADMAIGTANIKELILTDRRLNAPTEAPPWIVPRLIRSFQPSPTGREKRSP